ncbi:MAG: hypothetical protein ACTSVV_08735 [Promethearchaeota archaeon]
MNNDEQKPNMKCAKCGYGFIHAGTKDFPIAKKNMYECPKCGHNVQVAIDPSKASPIVAGLGGFTFKK